MDRFRKKPVIVEATQWFKHGDHPAVRPVSPWDTVTRPCPSEYGWCPTLEGGHIVSPGDWIIKGVAGELYPCKPDIFAATYERVP